MSSYPMPSHQWVPAPYVMPTAAAPIQQVDDYSLTAGHMSAAYKSDGQAPRGGIPIMLPSPETVPYNHMLPQVN